MLIRSFVCGFSQGTLLSLVLTSFYLNGGAMNLANQVYMIVLDDMCYLSSSNISPCVVPFLPTWRGWENWLELSAIKDCTAIFSEFVCILHT